MTKTTNKFSREVRDRAVRMFGEHRADYPSEWSAMPLIAGAASAMPKTIMIDATYLKAPHGIEPAG